jgi:hypothetical protein
MCALSLASLSSVTMLGFLRDYGATSAGASKPLRALPSQFERAFLEFPKGFTIANTAEIVPHVLRTVRKALARLGGHASRWPRRLRIQSGQAHKHREAANRHRGRRVPARRRIRR